MDKKMFFSPHLTFPGKVKNRFYQPRIFLILTVVFSILSLFEASLAFLEGEFKQLYKYKYNNRKGWA
jgi:hypothetical protein